MSFPSFLTTEEPALLWPQEQEKDTRHHNHTHNDTSWRHYIFRVSHNPRHRKVDGTRTSASSSKREQAVGGDRVVGAPPQAPKRPPPLPKPSLVLIKSSHQLHACKHASLRPPVHIGDLVVFSAVFEGQPPNPAVDFGSVSKKDFFHSLHI